MLNIIERYKNQIRLNDANLYVGSLQTFTFFCHNVVLIEQTGLIISSKYRTIAKQIEKQLKVLIPLKVIKPLKVLCLRIYQISQGISQLHILFLKICLQQSLLRQALPIIETKYFPKNLSKVQYSKFCRLSGLIYCQLQNYQESFKYLNQSTKHEQEDLKSFLDTIKKIILLSMLIDKTLTIQQIDNFFQEARAIQNLRYQEIMQKNKNFDYEYKKQQFFSYADIIEGHQLQAQAKQQLKKDNHLQIYLKILNRKQLKVRQYLKKNLVSKSCKLKIDEIQNIRLNSWQNIKKINGQGKLKIYKFDSVNKLIEFNQFYNQTNQEMVNKKVSQCMDEYKEIQLLEQKEKKQKYKKQIDREMDSRSGTQGRSGLSFLLKNFSR